MSAREPTSCFYPAIPPPVSVIFSNSPPHACPYLPQRTATLRAFHAEKLEGEIYHQFMDASFRRSGRIIYQPICSGCRACVPIRIPVESFAPTRSQRRCWQRNSDLVMEVNVPQVSEEKFDLYQNYQADRHEKISEDPWQSFVSFLYDSPVDTIEFTYRNAAGKLVAVGICDICSLSLSSVYFYYDPRQPRRGLGTYGVLREIDFALSRKIADYYLGYSIYGCAKMKYKTGFQPHEFLRPDGRWYTPQSDNWTIEDDVS